MRSKRDRVGYAAHSADFDVCPEVMTLLGVSLHCRRRNEKRDATMLVDQEHINTAAHRAYAGGGVSDKNCALCSTAGAINLLQGKSLWTTGMLAEARGAGDNREAMGGETEAQAKGIKETVLALAGAVVRGEIGSPKYNGGVQLASAVASMAQYPTGTVFVLLASGGIGHHWLNAVVDAAGSITYVDYQTDKVRKGQWNHGKVSKSDKPFHGVSGGTYEDSDTIYAIAFSR